MKKAPDALSDNTHIKTILGPTTRENKRSRLRGRTQEKGKGKPDLFKVRTTFEETGGGGKTVIGKRKNTSGEESRTKVLFQINQIPWRGPINRFEDKKGTRGM